MAEGNMVTDSQVELITRMVMEAMNKISQRAVIWFR